jgi:hypothetical protein
MPMQTVPIGRQRHPLSRLLGYEVANAPWTRKRRIAIVRGGRIGLIKGSVPIAVQPVGGRGRAADGSVAFVTSAGPFVLGDILGP